MNVLQVLPQRGHDAEDVAAESARRPAEVTSLVVAEGAGGLVQEPADGAAVATCRTRPQVSSWRVVGWFLAEEDGSCGTSMQTLTTGDMRDDDD